jgi:serine/threonine protein kinase
MNSYPNVGDSLGKYKLTFVIGSGGTATVYRAIEPEFNTNVAIKVLSPDLLKNEPKIREQFMDEAFLLSGLTHKNLVKVLEIEDKSIYTYIVMEYIEGATLDDIIKFSGKLPLLQALKISCEVCKALAYSYSFNIIHRDVKPKNIIITPQSEVKLTDFGLAKNINSPDKFPLEKGKVAGTFNYMSPEQFIDIENVDHRSDIYSLGVTMYEIFTGKLPFQTESIKEIIEKHIHEIPVNPQRFNSEISDFLSGIIMKMLEKKPEDRYQNYYELLDDLNSAEEDYIFVKEEEKNLQGENIKKLQEYSQKYIDFSKKRDLAREILDDVRFKKVGIESDEELRNKIMENLGKKSPFTSESEKKPDINEYVSSNLKKYYSDTGTKENDLDEQTNKRLQEKYQKYFKKAHGVEIDNYLQKNIKENIQKQTSPAKTNSISKEIKKEYKQLEEENKFKVSASKYIQKFKNLFEKK